MAKPTEQEKKQGKREWESDGKVIVGGITQDVKIKTKTEPNASGGYDTTVIVPQCRVTVKRKAV